MDSTLASRVQIGLFHCFEKRGKTDLVISGPDYGGYSAAVFLLSSRMIVGAMEAAVCGFKGIALLYAFFDRNHDPDIITGASNSSVKLIEHLSVDDVLRRTKIISPIESEIHNAIGRRSGTISEAIA